jgi:bacterioferritin-associated ferredoxin
VAGAVNIDRCVCKRTLFAQLEPVARAGGWDLDRLMAETGCGTTCGLCRPYLREMLSTGTTVFHEILVDPPRAEETD